VSKPQEIRLTILAIDPIKVSIDHDEDFPRNCIGTTIHFIEKSAADALAEALEKIAADMGTDNCDGNTIIACEALANYKSQD